MCTPVCPLPWHGCSCARVSRTDHRHTGCRYGYQVSSLPRGIFSSLPTLFTCPVVPLCSASHPVRPRPPHLPPPLMLGPVLSSLLTTFIPKLTSQPDTRNFAVALVSKEELPPLFLTASQGRAHLGLLCAHCTSPVLSHGQPQGQPQRLRTGLFHEYYTLA